MGFSVGLLQVFRFVPKSFCSIYLTTKQQAPLSFLKTLRALNLKVLNLSTFKDFQE